MRTKDEILNHIHVRMRFQSPFDLPVESILDDFDAETLPDLMRSDGVNMNMMDFNKSNIDIVRNDDGYEYFVYREFQTSSDCIDEIMAEKKFRLMSADGTIYESNIPGTIGGHKKQKIYGELDCYSARNALARGHYTQYRVFFKDEKTAIAVGYRPCGKCMKERHRKWKVGGVLGSNEYPWKVLPKEKSK